MIPTKEINDFCQNYPLYSSDKKIVIGKGSQTPELLIIGEAPGTHESSISGKPFTGRSGELLDKWLKVIPIKSIGVINSVFLMPLDDKKKIRKPTDKEIEDFRPWVIKIIETVKPKYILLLGDTACRSILERQISECFGKVLEKYGARVQTLYHPAYYLRNGRDGINDVEKLAFDELQQVTDIKINSQKAHDICLKHMVPEVEGAIIEICKRAGVHFKDKNTKDIFFADEKEYALCEFRQSNEFDLFEEDLKSKYKNTERFIFYDLKGGNYNFFGYLDRAYVDFMPMQTHFGTQKSCKKILLDNVLPASDVFKIYEDKKSEAIIEQQRFIPLHLHTEFSVGDGYGTTDEIAESLRVKGFEASAITDHGTMAGNFYFQKSMKRVNLKTIHGCEFYVKSNIEDEKSYHITILAKNRTGYQNMLKLQKIAVDQFYYKPLVTYSQLIENREGLLCLSGCPQAKHNQLLQQDKVEEAFQHLDLLHESFNEDFYIEIMPHYEIPFMKKINDLNKGYARNTRTPVVCTLDSHYSSKEDKQMHNVIKAINRKKKIVDPDVGFTGNTYFHMTDTEIIEAFSKLGQSKEETLEQIENTRRVAEKCNYEIKQFIDKETLPEMCADPEKELESLIAEKFKSYEFRDISEDRIKLEIERFKQKGFSNYVLMIKKIVDIAKEKDIRVGPGRGSVSGSLVCYLMGIHDTDPIKFNLMFDRFLSEIRRDMTDIDLDFQDTRRDELIEEIVKYFGKDKCKKVITFNKFHPKMAIRDVSRIYGISMEETEKLCRVVVTRSGGDARASYTALDTFTEFEYAKAFRIKYPEASEAIIKLEGKLRHLGVHAAAMVMTKNNTYEYVPLYKVGGEEVIAMEKKSLEDMGLVKIDILGLKTLDVIKSLEESTGAKPTGNDYNDKAVYENIISKGDTAGCFQAETTGFSKTLKQMKCLTFSRLCDANAMYRPGALHSGITAEYVRRCNGLWDDKMYSHPSYEHIVKDTMGLIIYQEQIMKIVNEVGGLSWSESESLRKVISKTQGKQMFDEFRGKFIAGAKRLHGIEPEVSGKIFDAVSTYGSYGFNKSHSASYSILTYTTAWYKNYFPLQFYAALLNRESVSEMEANYVADAKRHNIEIKPPGINISELDYSAKDGKIYCGISRIKGTRKKTTKDIVNKKPFVDVWDLMKRVKIGKSEFETLTLSGALDCFGKTRKTLVENYDVLKSGVVASLHEFPEYEEREKITKQLEYLNFPAEKHPILMYDDPFKGKIQYEKIADLVFDDFVGERWIRGIVTFINFKQEGLEGQWQYFENVLERKYAHLNVNDESGGNVLVHLAPEQYTAYKKYLESGTGFPVIIKGSSIPNYQKIYADALIAVNDVDKNHPIFKYVEDKRQKELDEIRAALPATQRNNRGEICDVKAHVICSVKYKVSKNKKAYALLMFDGIEHSDKSMCFKLDSKIFIAGEILVYLKPKGSPFIEIIKRL